MSGRKHPRPSRPADRRWHQLVRHAERKILNDLQTPLSMAALGRTLGVSGRYLRMAFQEVHGVSPLRHLRMLKLTQARRALMSARSQTVTVAETAVRHGFRELGRFSVEYREAFGESPSITLHRAVHENKRRRSMRRTRRKKAP
jgi:AraC-like DNA-binding protein